MEAGQLIEELVAARGDRLLRLAYQLTHERMEAEDLVQEALFSVYRGVRRRGLVVDHVEAYVRRAIVNEHLRRRRLHSAGEIAMAEPPDRAGSGSFDEQVVARDSLWMRLMTLPPRQRAVLVLQYYERCSNREIAEIVGCRESTVRSLASRGIATLRELDLIGTTAGEGDLP